MTDEIKTRQFNVVREATAKEKTQTKAAKEKAKQRSVKQAFLEAGKPNGNAELTPYELASKDPSSLTADQLGTLLRTASPSQLKKITGLKNIINDAVEQSKKKGTSVKSELEKKAQLAQKGVIKVQEKSKSKRLER